jgi:hydrocephalus-inducing protein
MGRVHRPPARMPMFSEDVRAEVAGAARTLFTVAGACSGTELRLTTDNLPFGPVALGSQLTQTIQLENSGDIRTVFRWDSAGLGPHFSVAPSEGVLPPGQDARLEVTFRPAAASTDIRVEKVLPATCASMGRMGFGGIGTVKKFHGYHVAHIHT